MYAIDHYFLRSQFLFIYAIIIFHYFHDKKQYKLIDSIRSIITNVRSERSFYQKSYVGHLVDNQTAPEPLKESEKNRNKFVSPF